MNWIMSVTLKHKSDNHKIFSQKQLHFRRNRGIIIVTERVGGLTPIKLEIKAAYQGGEFARNRKS